jgi:hypothetical protein
MFVHRYFARHKTPSARLLPMGAASSEIKSRISSSSLWVLSF